MGLTEHERELIARKWENGLVRPTEQWAEILRDLDPHAAAARIFGDLICYRADQKVRGGWGTARRDGFIGDVRQLANALEGYRQSNPEPPSTQGE